MKKIGRWLLLISCCGYLLAGCTDVPTAEKPSNETAEKPVSTGWCFASLNTAQQTAYVESCRAVERTRDTDETVTVGETAFPGVTVRWPLPLSSAEEVQAVYTALQNDHPEYVYLGNRYRYGRTEAGYVSMTLTYTMTAEARAAAAEALSEAIKEMLRGLPKDADAFSIELYCHDALLRRCRYHGEAAAEGADAYPLAFTAYGALVEGAAVCEGYSRAFQLLLRAAGIDSTLAEGQTDSGAHMWNQVNIDGAWYETDVTWDDDERGAKHTYFNLTSADMARTRLPRVHNGPTAEETAANYHRRLSQYIDSTSTKEMLEAAAKAATEETAVSLRFSEEVYGLYKTLLMLQEQWVLSELNRRLSPDRELVGYTCAYDDALCTLTLFGTRAAA